MFPRHVTQVTPIRLQLCRVQSLPSLRLHDERRSSFLPSPRFCLRYMRQPRTPPCCQVVWAFLPIQKLAKRATNRPSNHYWRRQLALIFSLSDVQHWLKPSLLTEGTYWATTTPTSSVTPTCKPITSRLPISRLLVVASLRPSALTTNG